MIYIIRTGLIIQIALWRSEEIVDIRLVQLQSDEWKPSAIRSQLNDAGLGNIVGVKGDGEKPSKN